MKYTLLEMVQRILESMGSDEVNSITDTEEATTVANIIKECYFEITGRHELPEHHDVYQLVASGNSAKPTVMTLPSRALDLDRLMYTSEDDDGNTSRYDVHYMSFDDYMNYTGNLKEDDDNVGSMTIPNKLGQNFTFKYLTDRNPTYYTTFNDREILFDSFDSASSSTLVGSLTFCTGNIEPEFEMDDAYVPDIDSRQFQLLLQASKAQASLEIRQVENPKAEKKERRNEIVTQRRKSSIGKERNYIGYGRK